MNIKTYLMLCLFLIIPAVSAQYVIDDSVSALYRFEDQNATLVRDYSGKGNDGSGSGLSIGASKGGSGTGSYSGTFDGALDFVNVSNANNNFTFGNSISDKPFSTGAWVFMNDATAFTISSVWTSTGNNREWFFRVDSSDMARFQVLDESASAYIARTSAALTLSEGSWIFLVGTYDGSGLSGGINIYRNAVIVDILDSTAGTYTAMEPKNADLLIGALDAGGNSANGLIDEAFVINRELTQSEISLLYANGFTEPNATADINLSLISPAEGQIITSNGVSFTYFVNKTGNSTLFYSTSSNATLINADTIYNVSGSNTFDTVFFYENQTVTWFVNHTYEQGTVKSMERTFEIRISPFQSPDILKSGVCSTDIGNVMLLWLVAIISIAVIMFGIAMGMGVMTFFGSILLLIFSWLFAVCSGIISLVMALFALVMMIWSVVTNIGFENTTFR